MIGALVGFACGLAATAAGARALRRQARGVEPIDRCPRVAIVLYVTDDTEGGVIDRTTGGLGFSHACLDACEVDSLGRKLLIDARSEYGVTRRPRAEYGDREYAEIVLSGEDAAHVYGCARAKVGRMIDLGTYVCSEFVVSCLPDDIAKHVRNFRSSRGPGVVSPNQIAAAFGATPGEEVIVQ